MGNFFGDMFSAFVSQGLPRELWDQLRPWTSTFGSSVLQRWGGVVARQERCQHVTRGGNQCEHMAVAECDACADVICLRHAFVNQTAMAICAGCVSAFRSAAREEPRPKRKGRPRRGRRAEPPPSPPDDERLRALAELGLDATATWPEVCLQFRKLTAKHHPDRYSDPRLKQESEERFKRITEAYHVLERRRAA